MSTSKKICNDGASKSNDDGVCEVNDMLQNMSTDDNNKDSGITNTCANCGKEGSDVTNTCNKCKSVMYCNAACKKKHRHKHKKDCEEHLRLAAERAAELHDELLFKQPPPNEDCHICFLQMPSLTTGWRYHTCCGKTICSGCCYANARMDLKKQLCAFCRTRAHSPDKEKLERTKKRVEIGDAIAIQIMGNYYYEGVLGLPQDYTKALELWHQAGELGSTEAYHNIACAYNNGVGVGMDKQKAEHYCELAAMEGHAGARHKLGLIEERKGNVDRALKHWMIATEKGYKNSLKKIKCIYSNGHATKDDCYSVALQVYEEYLNKVKSNQRDEAAVYDEVYKYY